MVENHQPHIVCLGAPSSTAQYIIVSENDKDTIPLEDNSLTCAIDKLFKMYWVCNLSSTSLKMCMTFLSLVGRDLKLWSLFQTSNTFLNCTTMYICPKCKESTSKDVRKCISHLRHVHALSDGQDYVIW